MSTIITSVFAQARPQTQQLTEEQKEQMQEVKEKYAPAISEFRQEIRVVSTEQHGLLTSKIIDEKAIYANVDKMGQLKGDMQKQTLTMRSEMQEVCPFDRQTLRQGRVMGNRQGLGSMGNHQGRNNTANNNQRLHQNGPRNGQGMQNGQGTNARKTGMNNSSKIYAQKGQQNKPGNKGQGMQRGVRGQGQVLGANVGNGEKNFLNLSIEQAEELSEIKTSHFWTIQETQNEIALLKAKNSSSEDQLKSIDEVNTLQTTLAKQKMALKLETMKVLTEEQRMMLIAKRGYNQGQGRGNVQGRGIQRSHQNRI